MWNKIKEKTSSTNFYSFLRFFSIFSGIFLIMTVLILQLLNIAIFASVDNTIRSAREKVEAYVNYEINKARYDIGKTQLEELIDLANKAQTMESASDDNESQSGSSSSSMIVEGNTDSLTKYSSSPNKPEPGDDGTKRLKTDEKLPSNIEVILFNEEGEALNVDEVSSFYDFATNLEGSDSNGAIKTDQRQVENYEEMQYYHYTITSYYDSSYPEIAYVAIVSDVTSTKNATSNLSKIIVAIMFGFWILSIWASYHLAKWTSEPIKEAYEKQKTFVENASHELRTPLAVLQNRLESLFRSPDSTILDNYENIASGLDEVRNMRLLTTNLLNLARRDDGIQVTYEDVNQEFFSKVFENYEMIAEEQEKEFLSINNLSKNFVTDRTLIRQLMTILFDNAVKYTGDDGKIFAKVDDDDKNVIISFADNGPGISDENKLRVFNRFYRVDKARTRQQGGFGLGLSLAKQIVEALNGKIEIRDNQPSGAIFEVKLPIKHNKK